MVMTTVGSEEQAVVIADALVNKKVAACVNIIPSIRSIYRFKGKVWDDEEYLLIIKSTENNYSEIEKTITELHNYEIPEILSFPMEKGSRNFLNWIEESVL
ncbi:periplasmic divalent cation tolerance protein [Thermotomaculum hydrothermale]|uniref:Periplasmic divalent cation tolerance protein n=2 Tax=Thermotomaculum hydrothermale TaxID=981385 RepID=A0A7R6PDE6_9BACT|nr:periplasmic divalent cation tolerance protein [Thermotomaculum hydrothermale]